MLFRYADAVIVEFSESGLPVDAFILRIWPLHFIQRCIGMRPRPVQFRLAFKTPILQILWPSSNISRHDFGISDVVKRLIIMIVNLLEVVNIVSIINAFKHVNL